MEMSTSDNWKWICLGFEERDFDFIQTNGMHQSTKTQNKRLNMQWLCPSWQVQTKTFQMMELCNMARTW
jgi:hypothetical protein